MAAKTDIISRMEAAQQRFGRLQLEDRDPDSVGSLLDSLRGQDRKAMQDILCKMSKREDREEREDRPESERKILRCAPSFDAQAEHEADLRYESRVDYESWQYDGPAEMGAE